MKKNLIVLVALVMVAVVAYEALDASDAEAGKRRHPSPPNYNFVLCPTNQNPCAGTPSADLMVGAAGYEWLKGGEGNDIYMSSPGGGDVYDDESTTSNDLYGGFQNGQFGTDVIDDRGGVDKVDLSTSVSAYASTDFTFHNWVDADSDGVADDLQMDEKNFGADDHLIVIDHFGSGRIEYIKFTDTTLSGANLPLS
jgi:hypothetical protein